MSCYCCRMCGGPLPTTTEPVVECEYCGSRQPVPSADSEKKQTLFARANRLRLACEFDRAAAVYESIAAEFPEEAEASWGIVLCRYGIEYVDDPATGKKVPTCHRSSFASVLEDADYQQTLDNADPLTRKLYHREAAHIEELRESILSVSASEKPYDIFICYKETDERGDRTLDSVLAQDLYDLLTNKGYRVFFSRISLEDKLGREYEPYIFAALNSAKVMLAVGTCFEHYDAVWVKNEWARFMKLMEKDQKKFLIPCFKDLDAYDMPKEFRRLQAQDLGKVGAHQDLLRGLQKLLPAKSVAVVDEFRENSSLSDNQTKILKKADNLVALGILALDAQNKDKATKHFEDALKLDGESIGAYLGLIRILGNSKSALPYVQKINSMPSDRVLAYIKKNRGIVGNPENGDHLLTIAIHTIQSEKLVEGMLDMGVQANAKDAFVYFLNMYKNLPITHKMIQNGANVNASICWTNNYKKDYHSAVSTYYESFSNVYHSALSTAISAGQSKQVIELLLKAGANINYEVTQYDYYHEVGKPSNGTLAKVTSILALAVANTNDTEIPKLLIEAGADVNYMVQAGKDTAYSILSYTVFENKYDLAKLLLENGANPNQKRTYPRKYSYHYFDGDVWTFSDAEEYSPISDAIWNIKSTSMLKLLLDFGGDPNQKGKRIITEPNQGKDWLCGYADYPHLMDALFYSSNDFIKILLDYGADPNITYHFRGISDYTNADIKYKSEIPVLGVTIIAKNREVTNMLIRAGASFSVDAVYQTRGKYIENSGGSYQWKEDRFKLSEYAFSDDVISHMGDLIRPQGWRGKLFGFLGISHRCSYRA